jgi:hypothetical protein
MSKNIVHNSSLALAFLLKGFEFSNQIVHSLNEEVTRCCLLEPTKPRTFLLIGQPRINSSEDLQTDHNVVTITRMFDVSYTIPNFPHDIVEIQKIESLGFNLNHSILLHLHPIKYNTSPSLLDVSSFILTDLVLSRSLTYAVIGFTEGNKPTVSVLTFKDCFSCPFSFKNLVKNSPIYDFKIKEVNV